MGKHREKTIEKVISEIQNISLKGSESEVLEMEHIAGFPPYLRGYHAVGYLLQSPDYERVHIWSENLDSEGQECSKILFNNMENLLSAKNVYKKSIIIREVSNLAQIIDNINQINYIYLLCDSEYSILRSFFKQISREILSKVRFLLFFDENMFDKIEKIREIRAFYSENMKEMGYSYKVPISSYISTITEQLYALAAQSDVLLYEADNLYINDELNHFLVENTLISKTIDPFWK
ncbi:hypothetical protein [Capnocytophaga cynodegmi]|uniref:Uncharacterized protein n=1 Tax=Capnocytophaga cynodegmi TaxID=28189 RepID=A0A0B7H8C5_9FLAO|nr:hypothetical protein [Capnocytophaga cynodegmi]CEN33888.1 conserved hypothetical protein [Capnocytophaga cynodegmi]